MSFDLDKVNSHNFPIEFDGSLSRKDNFFGSDVKFDKQTWDVQWSLFEQEGFVNGTYISLSAAAAARTKHVLLKSQAGNPEFRFTPETFGKSAGTTAMYMLVLGGSTGFVNKEWVRALFCMSSKPLSDFQYGLLMLICEFRRGAYTLRGRLHTAGRRRGQLLGRFSREGQERGANEPIVLFRAGCSLSG